MKQAVRRKRSKKKEQGRGQRTHRRTAAREQRKRTEQRQAKKAVEQRSQDKRLDMY
jgi:hypothetical protein